MEDLEQIANRKLRAYVGEVEKMSLADQKLEWYKTHQMGRAPDYDPTLLLNEVVNEWSVIMGNILKRAKVAADLPDRPATPPGNEWNRG